MFDLRVEESDDEVRSREMEGEAEAEAAWRVAGGKTAQEIEDEETEAVHYQINLVLLKAMGEHHPDDPRAQQTDEVAKADEARLREMQDAALALGFYRPNPNRYLGTAPGTKGLHKGLDVDWRKHQKAEGQRVSKEYQKRKRAYRKTGLGKEPTLPFMGETKLYRGQDKRKWFRRVALGIIQEQREKAGGKLGSVDWDQISRECWEARDRILEEPCAVRALEPKSPIPAIDYRDTYLASELLAAVE